MVELRLQSAAGFCVAKVMKIFMKQMQLTWLPDGCTVTWDDSTYQEYGAYSCLIDNGKQSKEHQVLGIAQMPLENKVNIQGRGPDDAINRRISLLVLNQQAEQAILHENAESQNESLDDLKQPGAVPSAAVPTSPPANPR